MNFIEFIWRNLIYNAYAKKIEINQNEIKAEAEKLYKNQKKIIEYNLSEIEILIENEEIIDKKVNEIKNVINRFSFEDAVVKFSISSSSSNDGKLGWINSNSLSNEILTLITKMNIGDVSEPVRKGDKIIILKLNDKKTSTPSNTNMDTFIKKVSDRKKNELFELYSNSLLSQLRNTKFIEYYK